MPDRVGGFGSAEGAGLILGFGEALDVDECFQRLAESRIGRVVYSARAMPAITHATCALDGQDLYFRPKPDANVWKAISEAVVAFQVENLPGLTEVGWTVTVTGMANACVNSWPRLAGFPLSSRDDSAERVFRLTPGVLTGQRLTRR